MLDKSISYKDIIMRAPRQTIESAPKPVLPEGFSFRFFEEVDEEHWARIETSVLEFNEEKAARDHFSKEFLPHLEYLKKRCLFVVNPSGLPIATANAWLEENESAALLHGLPYVRSIRD